MTVNEKRPVAMTLSVPFMTRRPPFDARQIIEGRDTKRIHDYALALALELQANASEFEDCRVTGIRLDGGSASMIEGSDLERLLKLVRACYDVDEGAPITLRTCPADINGANMPFFNRSHIARYDLELYSLEPQDFQYLQTLNYMDQMPYISSGFLRAQQRENMGFILLCGKKTISRWGFRRSILGAVRRPVCHVILQRCAGEDALDEDGVQAQIAEADALLGERGLRQYLPGIWALPGHEDNVLIARHKGAEVLGFGLGAETRIDGAVSRNTMDLERYLRHSGEYEVITEYARGESNR